MKINIQKKIGNLDIKFESKQDFIGILGESGAGKSMLLKCISGVETPDYGEIILSGKTLFSTEKNINIPPKDRKVGYLFQNYALFDNMTVENNILIVNSTCELNKIANLCKIENLLKRKPNQLSGGQKQRVALARILASDVELILLDEPFSALDNNLKIELEEDIFDLIKSQNKKCILVSHNLDEIYRNATEVGIIKDGKIIDFGSDIFENPNTEISAKLLGFDNFLYENDKKIQFNQNDIIIKNDGKYNGIVVKKIRNIDKNTILVLVNDEKIRINTKLDIKVGESISFDVIKVHKF